MTETLRNDPPLKEMHPQGLAMSGGSALGAASPPKVHDSALGGPALATANMNIEELGEVLGVRSLGIDLGHVESLARNPEMWPPIVVHWPTRVVIDGVHRLAAAKLLGHTSIQATLVEGAPLEVYLLALGLNSSHGLPLSRKDRRAAALRVLQWCPNWSDRRIAKATGVSDKTVASIRRATAEIPQLDGRVGSDGRIRRARAAQRSLLTGAVQSPRGAIGLCGESVPMESLIHREVPPDECETSEGVLCDGRRRARIPRAIDCGVVETCDGAVLRPMAAILVKLRRDPSVRSTEFGRLLIRLLAQHAIVEEGLSELLAVVPLHQRPLVADAAGHCARTWAYVRRQMS